VGSDTNLDLSNTVDLSLLRGIGKARMGAGFQPNIQDARQEEKEEEESIDD
jgi:hypothetical protein